MHTHTRVVNLIFVRSKAFIKFYLFTMYLKKKRKKEKDIWADTGTFLQVSIREKRFIIFIQRSNGLLFVIYSSRLRTVAFPNR